MRDRQREGSNPKDEGCGWGGERYVLPDKIKRFRHLYPGEDVFREREREMREREIETWKWLNSCIPFGLGGIGHVAAKRETKDGTEKTGSLRD